jgi:type IV fimbrial biogenesis protein FimT
MYKSRDVLATSRCKRAPLPPVGNAISGLTLVELLVTIAVGTILLTAAVPSFREVIANNRVATQANTLVTALNLARSEAVRRGVRVAMCKSGSSTSSTPGCSTVANWEAGWLVFVDNNGDGNCADGDGDGRCDSDNGEILRVAGPLAQGMTLRPGTNYTNWVAYLPTGTAQGNPGRDGAFRLYDDRGPADGRCIKINVAGHISTSVDATTSECP